MSFDVNGVTMARQGLILSQDGAMHSRMIFIRVLGLFNATSNYFLQKKKITENKYFLLTGVGGMGCGPIHY